MSEITVKIRLADTNNQLPPKDGEPIDADTPPPPKIVSKTVNGDKDKRPLTDPMTRAEFSARSLWNQYAALMITLFHNRDLREAFTKEGNFEEVREMLLNTGIKIPKHVDDIYLDRQKRFCGVNYWEKDGDKTIKAIDIEESAILPVIDENKKSVENDEPPLKTWAEPGLDFFSTEEITIILPDGSLLHQGDFDNNSYRIPDYPRELKGKYKCYYRLSELKYQELIIKVEGIENPKITVRVPYIDVGDQAIQKYKLNGKDGDIVLCSC